MTGEGQRAAADEEMTLAEEELRVVAVILDAGSPRIALTRAYFAAFHAIRGLLYSNGYEPRSHGGVHHLFSLHFVRTDRFAGSASRLLARLFKYREEADYALAFGIDDEGARAELQAAEQLVTEVRVHLAQNLPS